MIYLHLDSNFQPFQKSISYETFTFSGGEPHIKIKDDLIGLDSVCITTRIKCFNDVGLLLIAVDALKRGGVSSIQLMLPYFPGARQDRVMVFGEALSVKVYADIINNLELDKVIIFDPHSDVAPALLNNVEVISNLVFAEEALKDLNEYILISPDSGASKKAYKLAAFLGGKRVVECSKRRNVTNGNLDGFQVWSDDLKGATCVIVDDICDGGNTFLGIAKALKEKGAGELILVVSHGIFRNGFVELKKHFSKIYSSNSFSTIHHPSLTQIPFENGLLSKSSEYLRSTVTGV